MRIHVALVALMFVVWLQAQSQGQSDWTPKNVLFIAIDDLRPELGCYGATHAQSPHIDALAKRSLLFRNHFVQVPTCGASRYALLTGRSPFFSKANGNGAFYSGPTALSRRELPGAQSLPELFRRSGYRTVCIGKISHTADGRVFDYSGGGDGRMEVPGAWDELATPFGAWKRGWGVFFAYSDGKSREDGGGHRDVMQFTAESDDDLPDGLMASVAIEKLKELSKREEPFFMGLGFFKPHLPFVAPRRDWDAFEGKTIPLPPHNERSASRYTNRKSGEFFGYHFPGPKNRPLGDDEIRNYRRAYLACVRYTDRQVGRVLAGLDEAGLSESTVVVLWSDHGWNLGDSLQWGKHTALERAVRSPLLICVPRMESAGKQTSALVESIDLFPTLIELCNPSFQKTQNQFDGKSLVSILRNPVETVRDVSFSYWRDTVSVRGPGFRLIGKKTKGKTNGTVGIDPGSVELYSVAQRFDPLKNLADENPDIVSGFIERFIQFQKREARSESSRQKGPRG